MLNFPLTRRAFVAGTAALAAGGALTLVGCSVEQPIEPGPAPADPADDNAPTEPVAAQSGVARTLTAAVAYEGSDPNPIGTSSGVFLAAGWHVFEGLYELNMHTYRAECGLAADAPVQIDDLEYEVTLREDTVFSDGSPLTSADVVNAFERNGESDLYGAFLSFITAVSAPDERTVRFKLNAPMGSVLQERLALVRVFPATLTDEELASKPVGSGPWCYETINAADGGRISFTANHRYTGPWPATCERMEWSVLLDDTRRTDELIDKDVMVMEAAPVVRAEELADAGATVEWVPGFNLPFLMFNCEKPPFDDVRVRQALLYAIDVDSLIGTYMAGHARAATSLLPDYFRHYHRAATVYSYDPEKARKLLAEAGVDELALTLRANDNWVSTLAPAIAEDWKAVGVTAEVVLLDTTALFADLSTEPEPTSSSAGGTATTYGPAPAAAGPPPRPSRRWQNFWPRRGRRPPRTSSSPCGTNASTSSPPRCPSTRCSTARRPRPGGRPSWTTTIPFRPRGSTSSARRPCATPIPFSARRPPRRAAPGRPTGTHRSTNRFPGRGRAGRCRPPIRRRARARASA